MLIKVKFENDDKINEFRVDNKELSINQQVKIFLDKISYENSENRIFYALFNPASHMYMNSFEEIHTCKQKLIFFENYFT
jgi:hypothetical protein